ATVVGSQGIILRSTDGGETWTPQSSGTQVGLGDVSFVDANTGTAVGGQTILRTTDGGETWKRHSIPAIPPPMGCSGLGPPALTGVSFANADLGLAVGICPAGPYPYTNHLVFRTTDGGDTWTQVVGGYPISGSKWLYAVSMADAASAIAVGYFINRYPF